MISRDEIAQLWPFYFYKFMRGVAFLTTITLFIFFTEKGLSYSQAAILVAFASLTQIISELLTGSIADTFGRKKSVVISLLLDSIIILFIALTNSFWPLLLLFGLWGISTTLASGADQAWAIDSLIDTGRENLLDSYYTKSRMFFNAGMFIAGLLSTTILLFYDNQMLWFLRVAITLISGFVLMMYAKEVFVRIEQVNSISVTIRTAKEALNIFGKKKVLRLLGIASFFTFIAAFVAESVAVQDYKLQAGIPLEWWGILFFSATFIGLFTPHIGMRLSNNFKHSKNYLGICLVILALIYSIAILSKNIFFVAVLTILYVIIDDFYSPVEEKLYNKHTPSKQRASVNSLKAMIENSGLMIGMIFAGFLVDSYGGAITISIAALFVVPSIIMIFRIKEDR